MEPLLNNACRDRDFLALQARRLKAVPVKARPSLAAAINHAGLMVPTQWWLRLGIWIMRKRHKLTPFEAWYWLYMKVPAAADDLLEQTYEWMLHGQDADGEGLGGFNRVELAILVGLLELAETKWKEG